MSVNCKNCGSELKVPTGIRDDTRKINCNNCHKINVITFSSHGHIKKHIVR